MWQWNYLFRPPGSIGDLLNWLTGHGVCLCAPMRQDLARTREQVVAWSAARVIALLAATGALDVQGRNHGGAEACRDDCHGGDGLSDCAGRDRAVACLRQR